ncbi:MAG: PEP-CTERM sorting domain-containing protein [Sedimentisphaerales bacterium]
MYCVLTLFLLVVLASSAFGAAVYSEWRGAEGAAWNVTTNWNNGIVPTAKDKPGVQDPNYSKGGCKAFGSAPYTITSPDITAGITVACDQFTLGGTNGGKLVIGGGTMNISEYLTMGANQGENGVLYMNSGTIKTGLFVNNAHLFIGQKGIGTVYMNGGTIDLISVNPGNLRIADVNAMADGKLYLNAGTIYANDLLMPYAKAGSIDITGGVLQLIGNDTATVNGFVTAGKIITSLENGTIQATYNSGTNRTTVIAIPEPATICLLGFGVLSLIRRKK